MKGVELYARVRRAVCVEGLSRRETTRWFGIDPRTVAPAARTLLRWNSGTGKSHIALGLTGRLPEGPLGRFTTAASLVHELLEARDEKRPPPAAPARRQQAPGGATTRCARVPS